MACSDVAGAFVGYLRRAAPPYGGLARVERLGAPRAATVVAAVADLLYGQQPCIIAWFTISLTPMMCSLWILFSLPDATMIIGIIPIWGFCLIRFNPEIGSSQIAYYLTCIILWCLLHWLALRPYVIISMSLYLALACQFDRGDAVNHFIDLIILCCRIDYAAPFSYCNYS